MPWPYGGADKAGKGLAVKEDNMLDQIFGELDFDDCGYWNGRVKLDWFGEEQEVGLA